MMYHNFFLDKKKGPDLRSLYSLIEVSKVDTNCQEKLIWWRNVIHPTHATRTQPSG